MIMEMLKAELRKVWPYYAPFLVVMVGYILLRGQPLSKTDSIAALISIGQGGVLAWRIFSDPGATRSYIFSRPLSRRRIFFTRWALGLTLQALTIVVLFAVIASGARSWLQVKIGSVYHPMAWWFELQVLWPVGLFSLLAYEVQMFLKLRAEILTTRPKRWPNILANGVVIALTALVLLPQFLDPRYDQWYQTWEGADRVVNLVLMVYIAIITILATAASLHCYCHLEVEA